MKEHRLFQCAECGEYAAELIGSATRVIEGSEEWVHMEMLEAAARIDKRERES